MPAFCIALPVLPGKAEALREFGKTVDNPRRQEFEASERRLGIPKEAWFLQSTPQGDLALIYLEAREPEKSLGEFMASQDRFDRWFKDEVKEITGVDLNQPPAGPLPEQIISYGY